MTDGPALLAISVGAVFVYSGIKGKSALGTVKSVIQGAGPSATPQSTSITAPAPMSGTPDSGFSDTPVTGGSFQSALQQVASGYGWGSGVQWQALQQLGMGESGLSATAVNPTSKAYGGAQSLGHHFPGGPAPNGVNEYGGQGLTPAESRAASMGDPVPQAKWMCRYIKGEYGDPVTALRKWQSRNPHWY
jgi:hypothetical protein